MATGSSPESPGRRVHDFLGVLSCFIVLLCICVVSCPYVIYYLGMCGMDFSSLVRFRFGFDKNRGFGSVSVLKKTAGSVFFVDHS